MQLKVGDKVIVHKICDSHSHGGYDVGHTAVVTSLTTPFGYHKSVLVNFDHTVSSNWLVRISEIRKVTKLDEILK